MSQGCQNLFWHMKRDFEGPVDQRLTCQGRPCDMQNSSYMLPQELRLCPSDAKCDKVSGKIMRIENEFVDSEISSKH